MSIRKFFHKIYIGFVRLSEKTIPVLSEEKQYGNEGEEDFVSLLKKHLPDCKIKKNIIIETPEGNAEIDCLVLYNNKLFAVEVKNWKGYITERNGQIIKRTVDRWTDEIHVKVLKSPFKQLNRAIYLLRKQICVSAWINEIVYFNSDDVNVGDDNVWFKDMASLARYIVSDGKPSNEKNAVKFFNQCVSADLICSAYSEINCIICDQSLSFNTKFGILTRKDIKQIRVVHHWSYDKLIIKTVNDDTVCLEFENAKIKISYNGNLCTYALCKIDKVYLGI